jgi:hypothetical protein
MKIKAEIEFNEERVYNLFCSVMYDNHNPFYVVPLEMNRVNKYLIGNPDAFNNLVGDFKHNTHVFEPKVIAYLKANPRHYFRLEDEYSGDVHKLTWKKMCDGIKVMIQKQPSHFSDVMQDNDDAITADVWIQCALLGEVIYG